jgi:DNA-binding NarL/FixJ family response regulator
LLVDDSTMVRWGLRALLTESLGTVEVGEARDRKEAFAALEKHRYGLIVMELLHADHGGIELLSAIRRRHPRTPVLVLSDGPEAHYAVRALQAGAAGYVSKSAPAYELTSAVRRIFAGGRYISEAVAEQLASFVADGNPPPPHGWLSDRELEVLRGLGAGRSVGQLARSMKLSPKTVSTYRARILDKLRLSTNADLLRYALEHGLT